MKLKDSQGSLIWMLRYVTSTVLQVKDYYDGVTIHVSSKGLCFQFKFSKHVIIIMKANFHYIRCLLI